MMRADASAAVSVERFFQFSLLGLVTCGYLAVAGSGYLDAPTIVLTAAGLALRRLPVCGLPRLEITPPPSRVARSAAPCRAPKPPRARPQGGFPRASPSSRA